MRDRRTFRILMVGHSYVVALNRRLCRELALAGGDRLEVTVAAPGAFQGDLRPIRLEPLDGEPYALEPIPARLSSRIHVFTYGRRLRALLREGPWDVVHAWEEPYILAGGQIAFHTRRDAALVFTTFQNLPKSYPPPFNAIERYCMGRASGWTGGGRTVVEALQGRPGYRDRPRRAIPLGVDLEAFRPDDAAGRATLSALGWSREGPPIVGYLGRFVPQKGIGLLTRALDRLEPGGWRALFVGGGALEGPLREWAARQGDRARIVTGVAHDGVPAYLNAMDILAAPSQTTPRWKEQLGRMLIEAMGVGLPVVGSDSGEIPRVIADAGLVLPESVEDAWVEGLGRLLESPALRLGLRERGLAHVHAHYSWSVLAREYLDFFRQLREVATPAPAPHPAPGIVSAGADRGGRRE